MCELNKKFKEWKEWYSGEGNSICAQISSMLWNAAVFHTIYEARKYATDSKGNLELNEMVHNFIDRNFFGTQALSIRKLYDNQEKRKEKNRDVISLGRLVLDMKENKALITRENILSAFGFPYDYEKAINDGHQTNDSKMILNGGHSENVHKNIDLLAGVMPENRKPNDIIQDGVFDQLNKLLDKCKSIVNLGNKIFAHAATEQSKKTVTSEDLKISLAKIYKAHCRIVRIAAFIGQIILYESLAFSNFLSPRAGDEFEHFGKPFARQEDIKKLESLWDSYEKCIERLSRQPEKRFLIR